METSTGVGCAECAAELDHCHGTLIHHPDGAVDCTEQECSALDPARHGLVTDCASIAGGCDCIAPRLTLIERVDIERTAIAS